MMYLNLGSVSGSAEVSLRGANPTFINEIIIVYLGKVWVVLN